MRAHHILLGSLLALLCANGVGAAQPPSPLRLVPEQADLVLQVHDARRLVEVVYGLDVVKQLQGLLPICSYCKKIRDDRNYWQQVESYISEHSEAQFSHSICPECYEGRVKPELDQLRRLQGPT